MAFSSGDSFSRDEPDDFLLEVDIDEIRGIVIC